MTEIKRCICFPAIVRLAWEGQRPFPVSQRPQKPTPGTSGKKIRRLLEENKQKLKQIVGTYRLCGRY